MIIKVVKNYINAHLMTTYGNVFYFNDFMVISVFVQVGTRTASGRERCATGVQEHRLK